MTPRQMRFLLVLMEQDMVESQIRTELHTTLINALPAIPPAQHTPGASAQSPSGTGA